MDKQHVEKITQFSDVYGLRREDVRKAIGDEGARKATLEFLKTYPGVAYMDGLRKTKSRAMLYSVSKGIYDKGNHQVIYNEGSFLFSYRGTPIYRWDAIRDQEEAIDAGAFEKTMSTYNQRKEIKQAIEAFREGMESV